MSVYTFTHVVDNEDFQEFDTVEFPKTKEVVVSFELSEHTRWDNVMLEFAKFLDMVGYVGVYSKVQARIEDEWNCITKDAWKGIPQDHDEDASKNM